MTNRTRISSVSAALVLLALGLASVAQAASGATGPRSATATCSPDSISVSASIQIVDSVKATPVTAKGQHVAYRAFLYRWDGKTWTVAQTGKWLWGYAGYSSGHQVGSFRSYDTNQVDTTSFRLAGSGYYSVGVQYYWYENADVGSGWDYAAAQHTDPGGPNGNGWCKL